MDHYDEYLIKKILFYTNITQFHNFYQISKLWYITATKIYPTKLYKLYWITALKNEQTNFNETTKFKLSLSKYVNISTFIQVPKILNEQGRERVIPSWLERLLLDSTKIGNLESITWIANKYMRGKLTSFRANRCMVYTAHNNNLNIIDYLIKSIKSDIKSRESSNDYGIDNEDSIFLRWYKRTDKTFNFYRTYIECIRFKNLCNFKYLWKIYPIINRSKIENLITNCEIYNSHGIFLFLVKDIDN
tara:strand:- start:826 stop:1563 length:738 start_codon:yes stop_codon:yes gene_type:complete